MCNVSFCVIKHYLTTFDVINLIKSKSKVKSNQITLVASGHVIRNAQTVQRRTGTGLYESFVRKQQCLQEKLDSASKISAAESCEASRAVQHHYLICYYHKGLDRILQNLPLFAVVDLPAARLTSSSCKARL